MRAVVLVEQRGVARCSSRRDRRWSTASAGSGSRWRSPAATAGSTGRKPACAQIFWASGGVQVVLQRVGLVQVRGGGHHGDGVLDLERRRRVDVLDRLALPLGVDGLVLVADQHVAGALDEQVGGLPAGSGPGLDVLGDQLVDEVEARLRVLAAVALGRVRRQQVPLRRARTQRAGGDDLDPRAAAGRPSP